MVEGNETEHAVLTQTTMAQLCSDLVIVGPTGGVIAPGHATHSMVSPFLQRDRVPNNLG